jgi:hypothetical protein
MENVKKGVIINMDPETHKKLRELAHMNTSSMSQVVRRLINEEYRRMELGGHVSVLGAIQNEERNNS